MAAPAADPHPGHGAIWVIVGQLKYSPQTTNITIGDSILFSWSGPDTNHSVTADPGQTMDFDSDPGKDPAQISHPLNDGYGVSFTEVGTYTYHCKVHSFMKGTINVMPLPSGSSSPQQAAPKLSKLSAKPRSFCTRCAKPGTTVTYTVSSAASMRAQLRRNGRTVKEIDFSALPGRHSQRLKFKRMKRGRYVLRLVAIDDVSGKASKAASLAVRVSG